MSNSKFNKCKNSLKIVIVGNSGTGKTSFCNRWMKDTFTNDYKATVLSDFSYKIYEYKGNYYKIQFWDIAGQDKNIYTSKVFSKGAHGCIIVSDITNDETLQKTLLWKKAIDENTQFIDGEKIPSILIQNKIDLISDNDISENNEDIDNFCKNNKFTNYFRTSCKDGRNVNESMDYLLSVIIDKIEDYSKNNNNSPFDDDKRTSIVIQNPNAATQLMLAKRNTCCQYL
jgi:small GTP-binding protein